MTKTRPSVRRPVIVKGFSSRRRIPVRARNDLLAAEALDAPMPGRLLVLLSRLSRSEAAPGDADGDKGA